MRRPPFYLVLAAVIGLVLAACASPSGGGGGASDGGEPSSAAESNAPEESQDGGNGGGGGDGGGGGIGRTLPAGTWTGGTGSVDVTGDASASGDAPIQSMLSLTDGDSTTLTYASADGQFLLVLAIYSDSFAVSVTTPEAVGGGGTTTTCSVDWHSTDDNNLSADFSCPDSPAFTVSGGAAGTVDIDGSFTATR
jgi:hypothetical protein